MGHEDTKRTKIPDDAERACRAVVGAAIEVHRHLGPGFLESVYEEALCVEFGLRAIRFARQVAVELGYKGTVVGASRLDLLVEGCLIVELKSVEVIGPIHTAQVVSYLRATGLRLGLVLNFGGATLSPHGIKRVAL